MATHIHVHIEKIRDQGIDWLKEAVKSYKELLQAGFSIYKDRKKAIAYANENSTAGLKTKEMALKELGWN